MVLMECSCGFTCGTRTAWSRHASFPLDTTVPHYIVSETRTQLVAGPGHLQTVEVPTLFGPGTARSPLESRLEHLAAASRTASKRSSLEAPPSRRAALRHSAVQPSIADAGLRTAGGTQADRIDVGSTEAQPPQLLLADADPDRPVTKKPRATSSSRVSEATMRYLATAQSPAFSTATPTEPRAASSSRVIVGSKAAEKVKIVDRAVPQSVVESASPARAVHMSWLSGAHVRASSRGAVVSADKGGASEPVQSQQQAFVFPSSLPGVGKTCSYPQGAGALAPSGRHSYNGEESEARRNSRTAPARTEPFDGPSVVISSIVQPPEASAPGPSPLDEEAGDTFNSFVSAGTTEAAMETFAKLLRLSGGRAGSPRATFERLQKLYARHTRWKARSVWEMLQARAREPEYETTPLASTAVVVCGAGPCGLRVALELALLGAEVTVVEKRSAVEACTRINRVHLWPWCKQDLIQWGAKVFDPPGGTFARDNDYCHIGIGELQLLLLKNALLFGVDVRFGIEASRLDQGKLVCSGGSLLLPCHALVMSTGASTPLSRALGLQPIKAGLRSEGSAIGVVANFKNNQSVEHMAIRQFSWARQFNSRLFEEISAKVKKEDGKGIELENIVYYKGPHNHYMVMTPTKKSLQDYGVIRSGQCDNGLLGRGNVDDEALRELAESVGRHMLGDQPCESLLDGRQGAMIFDFSDVRRLESPATINDGMLVCAVGDALLEPFWPEGLGILRGFMSALDVASAIVESAKAGNEAALKQLTSTFTVLKSVCGQTASQLLGKDFTGYRLAPATRYSASAL